MSSRRQIILHTIRSHVVAGPCASCWKREAQKESMFSGTCDNSSIHALRASLSRSAGHRVQHLGRETWSLPSSNQADRETSKASMTTHVHVLWKQGQERVKQSEVVSTQHNVSRSGPKSCFPIYGIATSQFSPS